MVGLQYEYNPYSVGEQFLRLILDGVPIENYIWKFVNDDIYPLPVLDNSSLFNKQIVDGHDFSQKISTNSYQVISCNIQAFSMEKDITDLRTYEDYLNSKCQIVVVVIDNQFVDILAKDKTIVEQVYRNAVKNCFQNIRLLETVDCYTLLSDIH